MKYCELNQSVVLRLNWQSGTVFDQLASLRDVTVNQLFMFNGFIGDMKPSRNRPRLCRNPCVLT